LPSLAPFVCMKDPSITTRMLVLWHRVDMEMDTICGLLNSYVNFSYVWWQRPPGTSTMTYMATYGFNLAHDACEITLMSNYFPYHIRIFTLKWTKPHNILYLTSKVESCVLSQNLCKTNPTKPCPDTSMVLIRVGDGHLTSSLEQRPVAWTCTKQNIEVHRLKLIQISNHKLYCTGSTTTTTTTITTASWHVTLPLGGPSYIYTNQS
jgi:hypothetical protein